MVLAAAGAVAARQAPPGQFPEMTVQGMPDVLPGTPVPLPEAPPDILWSVAIAAAPVTSPLIAGEYVLLSHLPGVIAAHRVADGTQVWQVGLNPEQPLVADNGVLFVASGEAIHALRIADGAVAWRAPTGPLTAPLLAQDGWVVAASATKLTAWRASDGTGVWSIDAPLQRESAAISGNTLFVPTVDGRIRALDLQTSTVLWERRLGASPGEPLVVGDAVFFGAGDKSFYCLDASSGETEWKHRVGATIRGRASADDEHVFFTAVDNLVRALDLGHGAITWQTGLPFRPLTGPVVAGGTVFISGPGNAVRMLRAADGSTAGTVSFPAKLAIAPGLRQTEFGVAIAAITGGLEEAWSLALTRPVRAVPVTGSKPR